MRHTEYEQTFSLNADLVFRLFVLNRCDHLCVARTPLCTTAVIKTLTLERYKVEYVLTEACRQCQHAQHEHRIVF